MPALENLLVLLVDDDEELRKLLGRWAKWSGLRLDTAADGAAGLSLARATSYDVVLFDLRMPEMDGPTFFRALKHEQPELARRAVALTGDVSADFVQRFLAEARCRWLLKPFEFQDVARAIERAWAA
jgi:CheY-like chemotaxis protein